VKEYLIKLSGDVAVQQECAEGNLHWYVEYIDAIKKTLKAGLLKRTPKSALNTCLTDLLQELFFETEELDCEGISRNFPSRINLLYEKSEGPDSSVEEEDVLEQPKVDVSEATAQPFDFYVRNNSRELVRFTYAKGKIKYGKKEIDHRTRINSVLGDMRDISLDYISSPGVLFTESETKEKDFTLIKRLEKTHEIKTKLLLLEELAECITDTSCYLSLSLPELAVCVVLGASGKEGLCREGLKDGIEELMQESFCRCTEYDTENAVDTTKSLQARGLLYFDIAERTYAIPEELLKQDLQEMREDPRQLKLFTKKHT